MNKRDKARRAALAAAALFGDEDEPTIAVEPAARAPAPARKPDPGFTRAAGPANLAPDHKAVSRPAGNRAGKQTSKQQPAVRSGIQAPADANTGNGSVPGVLEPVKPKMGTTSAGVPYECVTPVLPGERGIKPRKWKDGDLKVGDPVWYRGERYWIVYLAPSFHHGLGARIEDKPYRPHTPTDKNALSFMVDVDCLDLAPPVKNIYGPIPTMAAEERKARAKAGIHDIGDPVAVLLRSCKSLDDVFQVGAKCLEVQVYDLRAKYAHLNHGQQRMNIGNRMRAAYKKGLLKLD